MLKCRRKPLSEFPISQGKISLHSLSFFHSFFLSDYFNVQAGIYMYLLLRYKKTNEQFVFFEWPFEIRHVYEYAVCERKLSVNYRCIRPHHALA